MHGNVFVTNAVQPAPREDRATSPWPEPPRPDFLPLPRREQDLLAYWEWLLYEVYQLAWKFQLSPHKSAFRAKDFWQCVASCAWLQTHAPQCHDLAAAHNVLVQLFKGDWIDCPTMREYPDHPWTPKMRAWMHAELQVFAENVTRAWPHADPWPIVEMLLRHFWPLLFPPNFTREDVADLVHEAHRQPADDTLLQRVRAVVWEFTTDTPWLDDVNVVHLPAAPFMRGPVR